MTDLVDLDELKQALEAAMPGPWFYNGYSAIFSQPMAQAHDDFWSDERLDDGHTYEHRVGKICDACGRRPVLDKDGNDTDRQYWDCARSHEADDVKPVAASVMSSYGDTATGARVGNARLIEKAVNALPTMIDELEQLRGLMSAMGYCTVCRDGSTMPCENCGVGL